MCGDPLSRNLIFYLSKDSRIDIPIYHFQRNEVRELPCIVVGYTDEEIAFTSGYGHYNVDAYCKVLVQGYDDAANSTSDYYIKVVTENILSTTNLLSAMNKQATEVRPVSGFHINYMRLDSIEKEIEGHSTDTTIYLTGFCRAIDM